MTSLADVFEGRERWCVIPCDCRFAMSCMPDNSVDAIVCDPPYGLGKIPDPYLMLACWLRGDAYTQSGGGFMGKEWDSFIPGPEYWREAFRVLKPGGHLLAFAGTRTADLMGLAIRLAFFEIRDAIAWLYASGFPKSLDVAKQLDKAAGHWRGRSPGPVSDNAAMGGANYARADKGGPITAAAAAAAGYGTALKPAFEPVIVARKPLEGTVAANFVKYGTGALNIDGCRIECSAEDFAELDAGVEAIRARGGSMENSWKNSSDLSGANPANQLGRWPANVCLDEEMAAELDAQSGERPSGVAVLRNGGGNQIFGRGNTAGPLPDAGYTDTGGASRFFFTAKASRSERDAGLDEFAPSSGGGATDREDGSAGLESPRAGAGRKGGARNTHPTVKSREVMRWLVRLVTRPGSLVLDPFCGSGTTGVATMLEGDGRRFIGLELEPLHVDFARARIAHVVGGSVEREVKDAPVVKPAQVSIFEAMGGGK